MPSSSTFCTESGKSPRSKVRFVTGGQPDATILSKEADAFGFRNKAMERRHQKCKVCVPTPRSGLVPRQLATRKNAISAIRTVPLFGGGGSLRSAPGTSRSRRGRCSTDTHFEPRSLRCFVYGFGRCDRSQERPDHIHRNRHTDARLSTATTVAAISCRAHVRGNRSAQYIQPGLKHSAHGGRRSRTRRRSSAAGHCLDRVIETPPAASRCRTSGKPESPRAREFQPAVIHGRVVVGAFDAAIARRLLTLIHSLHPQEPSTWAS